ncbi:lactam utilization protein LamB [Seonamhaeicola sp. S2-3]|uniref:5-oxoprolinase subunit PxpA n=1 Tax=Seonamhaeicola sp. S2-3 TaxID=1936081 RepID=UPI000972AC89|nr:5-oxoprolinase subunit PxpA [Seonamhaeicola sp. S2-3]APY12197.1 lactam utilization protein LamB [Seonamhaeicola sp. S2-3]
MYLYSVDINADVGEGIGNESKLLPYLSSCNIACGGHAGNEDTMRKVVKLAKAHKVKIGAHPSFPDKENFGRVKMDISCAALYTSLKHQLSNLLEVLHSENATLHHIKPHGALYNLAAVSKKVAGVVIELIKSMQYPVQLYVPYKSVIAALALENDISITYEAFADRNYNDDLSLVSRKTPNALITDDEVMKEHVLKMVTNKKVTTVTGKEQSILVNTICVHGDNENAIKLVEKLHKFLVKNHIKIQ